MIEMDDVPDNIMKKQPGEGMFVVRYVYVALFPPYMYMATSSDLTDTLSHA